MIGSPLPDTLSQRWSSQTGFNPQTEFQRVDRSCTWRQRFVESPPDDHGAKQRRKAGTMLTTSTIDPSLKLQARQRLIRAVGLHVVQHPHHDTAADLT